MTKGNAMPGNWRYMLSPILFLGSGFLFLFILPRWGPVPAYAVSLPIFTVGVALVILDKRNPPRE